MTARLAVSGALVLLLLPAVATPTTVGQSLADVARKEAERRGTVTEPARVYTDNDLTPDFTTPLPDGAPAETQPVQGVTDPAEPVPGGLEGAAASTPSSSTEGDSDLIPPDGKGEAYWRERATRLRARLETQRGQVAALQSRLEALASDQDASAPQERDIARRALAKAQSDLGYFQTDLDDFEALARAKNIPAAWLR